MSTQAEHDAAHPGMTCGDCPKTVAHLANIGAKAKALSGRQAMTGLCPCCRQWFALTRTGLVRKHRLMGRQICAGTNREPSEREMA